MKNELLTCKFCGKVCKNNNSLAQHTIRCHHNPNRIDNIISLEALKKVHEHPWNKGLTKETDERVQKGGIKLKEYRNTHQNPFKGKHHSEETKKTISNKLKGNKNWLNSINKTGFGKRGEYKGIHCDSSYELVFLIYCLDKGLDISRCSERFQYISAGRKHTYTPDFIVEGVYVEIKGYWKTNLKLKENAVISQNKKFKIYFKEDLKPMFAHVKQNYSVNNLNDLINLYD